MIGFDGCLNGQCSIATSMTRVMDNEGGPDVWTAMKGAGIKMINIGGGSDQWTTAMMNDLIKELKDSSIKGTLQKNFQGICYDIETQGDDDDDVFYNTFEILFRSTKQLGLLVLVTISNSSPYGFHDGPRFMKGVFACPDVDFVSPQLYQFDFGTVNEYDPGQVSWDQFATLYKARNNKNLKIIPSLFSVQTNAAYGTYDLYNTGGTNQGKPPILRYGGDLPDYKTDLGAKAFFASYGVDTYGALQFINGTISPQTDSCPSASNYNFSTNF